MALRSLHWRAEDIVSLKLSTLASKILTKTSIPQLIAASPINADQRMAALYCDTSSNVDFLLSSIEMISVVLTASSPTVSFTLCITGFGIFSAILPLSSKSMDAAFWVFSVEVTVL